MSRFDFLIEVEKYNKDIKNGKSLQNKYENDSGKKFYPILYTLCIAAENSARDVKRNEGNISEEAVKLCDVSTVVGKVRMALEYIVDEIRYPTKDYKNLDDKVKELFGKKVIDKYIKELLDFARRCGNSGAHYGPAMTKLKLGDNEKALDALVEICLWFVMCHEQNQYSGRELARKDLPFLRALVKKYPYKCNGCGGQSEDFQDNTRSTNSIVKDCNYNDELKKKHYESENEYAKRIGALQPIKVGEAQPGDFYTYANMLIVQHGIDDSYFSSGFYNQDKVVFYIDGVDFFSPCAANLVSSRKAIDDECCWDYDSIVVYADGHKYPVKFIYLEQMKNESRSDFAKRISELQYIPIATCGPIDSDYDIKKEILPFELWPLAYAQNLEMQERLDVDCSRKMAKLIDEYIKNNNDVEFQVFGKVTSDLKIMEYIIWNDDFGVLFCNIKNKLKKISDCKRCAASEKIFERRIAYYEEASRLGDVESMDQIGRSYFSIKDYEKAFLWFKRAANHECASAQNGLAYMYCNGLYVKKDEKEAVEWCRKAANHGYEKAQLTLGDLYADGIAEAVNQEMALREAIRWYGCAAEQNVFKAKLKLYRCCCKLNSIDNNTAEIQYYLGKCYYNGWGVKPNIEVAAEWYNKAAQKGYAPAQTQLGYCCERYNGLAACYGQFFYWYNLSAKSGDALGQYYLGQCFLYGKGVAQNLTKCVDWFERAAAQGLIEAQYKVAECYKNGDGVGKSDVEAAKWYAAAASKGHKEAQYKLAGCYARGKGVKEDSFNAVRWYEKAAEQGHMVAQYELGSYYYDKGSCQHDEYKAIDWYKKAVVWLKASSAQGYMEAKCKLANCYYNGNGVSKSPAKAYKLYNEAKIMFSDKFSKNISACIGLGDCYYYGQGVGHNDWEAVTYYKYAAQQDDGMACYKLALCYLKHEKYRAAAEPWLIKAAEQGVIEAKSKLGYYFLQESRYNEAEKWLQEAVSAGCVEAKEYLQKLNEDKKIVNKITSFWSRISSK